VATRTRKSAAERREEIAIAVLCIIGRRGLTSLTMSAIAAEIGVTSGALFRHFDTREDILRGVVRHAVARIDLTFPDESLPPRERMFALARNRIRLLGPEPGLAWLMRSEQAYLTLPEDAVDELRDVARRSRRFIMKALREGAADGSIRDDIPPDVLLVPITGTIHALIGMPGAARHANGKPRRNIPRVLAALERMIAAPERAES
jgi:TetR/AcrR family transcriptional regulator